MGEIRHALEVPIGDQEGRIPLRDAHPAPDLWHEQTDVVIHAGLGPEASGTGQEHGVLGDGQTHEGRIEIVDRRQCIEGALGESSLAASPGRRRGLAGHAGDELHERLRQLHVMDRAITGQRTHSGFGRVVPATRQDGMHRRVHGTIGAQAPRQSSRHGGQMTP